MFTLFILCVFYNIFKEQKMLFMVLFFVSVNYNNPDSYEGNKTGDYTQYVQRIDILTVPYVLRRKKCVCRE